MTVHFDTPATAATSFAVVRLTVSFLRMLPPEETE